MKVTLFQAGGLLLVGIVISVVLGIASSRFFGGLQDRVDVNRVLPRASRGFRLEPQRPGPQPDIVDETGEVTDDHEPLPVEHWSEEGLDALWEAIHDGEAFEIEMACYELRSEIELVGVAGFTHRWRWKGQRSEAKPHRDLDLEDEANSGKES